MGSCRCWLVVPAVCSETILLKRMWHSPKTGTRNTKSPRCHITIGWWVPCQLGILGGFLALWSLLPWFGGWIEKTNICIFFTETRVQFTNWKNLFGNRCGNVQKFVATSICHDGWLMGNDWLVGLCFNTPGRGHPIRQAQHQKGTKSTGSACHVPIKNMPCQTAGLTRV